MRETPLSNCEREFLLKAIEEKLRIDGRQVYDYRRIRITFGVDRGCCQVQIGSTRVLAQVSCEVTVPKEARPKDGILFTNIELSPMASPLFEAGRPSDYSIELNRLLERCIKESRCIDTESLCIVKGEKVWELRVDLHVLNHSGNILDCASIAAVAALMHFRRPDVTIEGEEVTIHSIEERDPVPLNVLHIPIFVSFAFFQQGKYVLLDPGDKEEEVMDGRMVIAVNKFREICALQMTGDLLLVKEQVLRCTNIAVAKVKETTDLIQRGLENDAKARLNGKAFGFAESLLPDPVTVNTVSAVEVDLMDISNVADTVIKGTHSEDSDELEIIEQPVTHMGSGVVGIGQGGPCTWDVSEDDDDEHVQEAMQLKPDIQELQQKPSPIQISDDSEEESVSILHGDDLQPTHNQTHEEQAVKVVKDAPSAGKTKKLKRNRKKHKK